MARPVKRERRGGVTGDVDRAPDSPARPRDRGLAPPGRDPGRPVGARRGCLPG